MTPTEARSCFAELEAELDRRFAELEARADAHFREYEHDILALKVVLDGLLGYTIRLAAVAAETDPELVAEIWPRLDLIRTALRPVQGHA